ARAVETRDPRRSRRARRRCRGRCPPRSPAVRRLDTAGSRRSGERRSLRRRRGPLGGPGGAAGAHGRDPRPGGCGRPPAPRTYTRALGGRLAGRRIPRSRFTGGPGGRRGPARGGRLGDLCGGFRPLASAAGYFRLMVLRSIERKIEALFEGVFG